MQRIKYHDLILNIILENYTRFLNFRKEQE